MFERFTDRARRTVVLSQEEARGFQHNYIGTEHLLLGLLGEGEGVAARALTSLGITQAGVREEVIARVGRGHGKLSGHIPFTPRAKKVLELALREALQLSHNYIGTEHILLGIVQEGDGIGAQILRAKAGDLATVRAAVLAILPTVQPTQARRWLLRHFGSGSSGGTGEAQDLNTSPATTTALTEAARLAGTRPVGSHHLLLAALADPDTVAARTLAELGLDLDQAREALRRADVTGTSDEQPEERGRRHMTIQAGENAVTIEATDDTIVALARAAAEALGDQAGGGTIPGGLPACTSLGQVWQALHDSLEDITRRVAAPAPTEATAETGTAQTSAEGGPSAGSGTGEPA